MHAFLHIHCCITNLMVAGMVAAVACCTSGAVVRDGVAGIGQLLPKPSVHILLHKGIDQKTGERVDGNDRFYEEKTHI